MSTYIHRADDGPGGPRLAVKDCVDVAGLPTTMGCRALLPGLAPAAVDAACLRGARSVGARIVGKTNLSELCHSGTGVNRFFGTPCNPIDPRRVPGGSSSGSAVAVAEGSAEIALGTDTTGSVRIPAAACGIAALITTRGRVPMAGVHPLAPSLDTIGVLAGDVAGLGHGLDLLAPFLPTRPPATERAELILTLRLDERVHPDIASAIRHALAAAGLPTRCVRIPRWPAIAATTRRLMNAEAYRAQARRFRTQEPLSPEVRRTFASGRAVPDSQLGRLRTALDQWRRALTRRLRPGVLLAVPTLLDQPPPLSATAVMPHANGPVNAAGLPALCLPVPGAHPFASLQLVGSPDSERLLLATARDIEAAEGDRPRP